MSKGRKLVSRGFQNKLVWIPSVNALIYPIWFYNMWVSKVRGSKLWYSWFCSVAAFLPWLILDMLLSDYALQSSPYLNLISQLIMYIGLTVMGHVLIHFQSKYLDI